MDDNYVVMEGTVGEMGTATAVAADLPVPAEFLAQIQAEDEAPMFVTAEVESGWSKSKRNWKPEHLQKVVKFINDKKMGGTLGHPLLNKDQYDSAFPKPQVVWIAAKGKEIGGKYVATFKGYVLKSAEAREYLKLGLIDGISIFGPSKMRPVQGGYEVLEFEPESIDFARKGRSGMPSRILALAGEMGTEGGRTVDPKEIAALGVDELRTHAPLVVAEIERQATAELNEKVGEQTALVATLQPEVDVFAKVKELLKLADGENPIEKLTSLMETIEGSAKESVREFVASLVDKKIKTDRGRALVRRLIGEQWADQFEVGEDGLTDELKKEIEEKLVGEITSDSDIKELVGEMEVFNDDDTKDRGGSTGGSRMGGRSSFGTRAGEDTQRRGSLVITKQKIGA